MRLAGNISTQHREKLCLSEVHYLAQDCSVQKSWLWLQKKVFLTITQYKSRNIILNSGESVKLANGATIVEDQISFENSLN